VTREIPIIRFFTEIASRIVSLQSALPSVEQVDEFLLVQKCVTPRLSGTVRYEISIAFAGHRNDSAEDATLFVDDAHGHIRHRFQALRSDASELLAVTLHPAFDSRQTCKTVAGQSPCDEELIFCQSLWRDAGDCFIGRFDGGGGKVSSSYTGFLRVEAYRKFPNGYPLEGQADDNVTSFMWNGLLYMGVDGHYYKVSDERLPIQGAARLHV
jgi:hypothetical protein